MYRTLILITLFIGTICVIVHPSPANIIKQADISADPTQSINIGSPCLLHHSVTGHQLIDTGYYFRKVQSRHNNKK